MNVHDPIRAILLDGHEVADRAVRNELEPGGDTKAVGDARTVGGVDLAECVRRITQGETLLATHLTARHQHRAPDSQEARFASLSPQELRILSFLSESLTNRQIARQMYLAEKTVKNYVSNLLVKLDMRGRTEAAVYATKLAAGNGHHTPACTTYGHKLHPGETGADEEQR